MKKHISKVLALLLALSMIGTLTACGPKENGSQSSQPPAPSTSGQPGESQQPVGEELADKQVFSYILPSEPALLDPWLNNSGDASVIIAALHEPTLRKQADGSWTGGVMSDYKTNDTKTVHTLTLRDGANWQDGTPITLDDYLYSVERAISPATASPIAYRYFPIVNAEKFFTGEATFDQVGVKAVDAKTLEITTTEPSDFLVDLFTDSSFAPIQKAAAQAHGELYGTDPDKVVSSGPFKLTEWTHKNSMILEKNENYWDAANVKLQTIEVTITADVNTRIGMYQSGQLSVLKVPADQKSNYPAEEIHVNPRLKVTFIEFNPANEYLGNIKIREALSIAFNRQIFAEQILKNPALAAYGLVPPGVLGKDGGDFREQAGPMVKDASDAASIERAKTLLSEGLAELGKTVADLQDGFSIQCMESGKQQAQSIQNMWKTNLGVEMPVSVLEINVLLPMLMGGTFDCVIGGGQDSSYRDPYGFMQFIYDENKWDNQEFRTLVEKAHTQTGNDRIQTWMDIEKLVLENFIYIPQVYAENYFAVPTTVKGLNIFAYGYEFDFKDVRIVK